MKKKGISLLIAMVAIAVTIVLGTEAFKNQQAQITSHARQEEKTTSSRCPRLVIPPSCQQSPASVVCSEDVNRLEEQCPTCGVVATIMPPSCLHHPASAACAQDAHRMREYAKENYPNCGLEKYLPSVASVIPPLTKPSPPPGVAHPFAYTKYSLPAPGFSAALMWMAAIQDTRRNGPSWIEVDWLKLHAVINGQDHVILSDEYNDNKVCGGLFSRYPWFVGPTKDENMPVEFDRTNGYLILRPSARPDKIYHWWTCSRVALPPGTQQYWAEAKVRVHGSVAVQAGIDYWKNTSVGMGRIKENNREGGVSDWIFEDDPGWQILTVAKL